MKNNLWFTLIETLVSVIIAAILMTSVTILISNWLKSNTKSQNSIKQQSNNIDFKERVFDLTNNFNWEIIFSWSDFWEKYKTGYFLKTNSPELPITFIWIKSFTWYCDSYSWITENSWTFQRLTIKWILPDEWIDLSGNLNSINYSLSSDWNSLFSWSQIIVWDWYPWNLIDNSDSTKTQLNHPFSLIAWTDSIFIADTLNDRILSYSWNLWITEVLWPSNWISKPNSLYLNWNDLYIWNVWNWKVYNLSFSSSSESLSWNNLSIYSSWNLYPYYNWYSFVNNIDWTWSLNKNIFDDDSDYILKNFDIIKSWNVFNFRIEYYENYNCLDENGWNTKEILIKKSL